jgi:hypothetical protein
MRSKKGLKSQQKLKLAATWATILAKDRSFRITDDQRLDRAM